MGTPAAPVDHTTELALSEKRKLVKRRSVREQVVDVPLAAAPAAGD